MRNLLIILYRFNFLKRTIPSILKICIRIFNINNVNIKYKKVKFYLNLKNPIDREIYLKDKYENKQINYLIKFIKKKNIEIFIDIGAHMGFYSINLYKIVKNIYAFEPSLNNYNQLKQNVSINKIKNIKIFNKALSDITKKKIKMWVPDEDKTGGFSIKDPNDHEFKKYNSNKIFNIISSCEKLDKILKIKKKKIAIKIDVERHEEKVLKGGLNIVKNNKAIFQIEIFPCKKKKVFDLLEFHNYQMIHRIGNDYFFSNY